MPQALEQVQDRALAGKNDARVVADDGNRAAGLEAHAVEDFGVNADVSAALGADGAGFQLREDIEDAGDGADPGENAILLGADGRLRLLQGIDAGGSSGVARGVIFRQRVLEDGGNTARIPVHREYRVQSTEYRVQSNKCRNRGQNLDPDNDN